MNSNQVFLLVILFCGCRGLNINIELSGLYDEEKKLGEATETSHLNFREFVNQKIIEFYKVSFDKFIKDIGHSKPIKRSIEHFEESLKLVKKHLKD